MRKTEKGTFDYLEDREEWRWRGYYKEPVTGKTKRKSLYGKSKKELRERVEIWRAKVEGGEAGSDMTLEAWVKVWLDEIIGNSVKIRTKEIYEYVLGNHILPAFGSKKLSKINGLELQEYLNSLNYAPSTITKIRRYSIMVLDAAVNYGYLAKNPARQTRAPRQPKREIIALAKEQTEAIIEAAKKGEYQANPRKDKGAEYLRRCYHCLILLAVDTGMREGELGGLQWEDVDFKTKSIEVRNNLINCRLGRKLDSPKTVTSGRKIILTERGLEALKKWQEYQNDYATEFMGFYQNKEKMIFTTSTGSYFDSHNFLRRCWSPIVAMLGLNGVTFHSLRHAHASQLIAAGVSPLIVQQRLGHASLDVTLRTYTHLLPNLQQLEMTKINLIFGDDNKEE